MAVNAASAYAQDASPVYRFYNTQKGLHFFTISAEERDDVLRRYPWFTYEGVAFYGYTQAQPDTRAVYRFFNTSTGAHFYTMSASERDFIVATYPVFVYEGPVYFASPFEGNGRAALYRFYNTRTNAHFFTTSSAERDHVILTWPWFVYEETAYHVYTSATPVATSSGNAAPKATLAASAAQVPVPGAVTLTADASDPDGAVVKVVFYLGSAKIAETVVAPYTFTYNVTVNADLLFSAVAFDAQGASGNSNSVMVKAGGTVIPAPIANAAPRVAFTLSNTLVQAPGTVTITATASDADGTVAKVTLYLNGAKLIDLSTAPYTYTLDISAAGTYVISADATDNAGATASALPQNIVSAPPVVVTTSSADVWRLLNQATFGASQSEAARVQALGIPGWIEDQFRQPASGYPDSKYNRIQLRQTSDCTTRDPSGATYPASSPQAMCVRDHLTLAMLQRDFFTNAVSAPDQLRQRVAWALSQIIVTSGVETDLAYAHVMSRFQSILFAEAFGNFESLLKKVTLSPAMGNYLDMVNNDKPNGMGRVPNENYAREIMQLFSIGLDELNIDGTPVLDASGNPVPTYDQTDVVEFSRVFTGYTYADPANPAANATRKNPSYYAAAMVPYPIGAATGHDTNAKTLLNGVVLAANQPIQQDIDAAVRNVFVHPNTGPFFGKQLIQRLVTGNPSPAYVARVAGVFNNNGAGVRGDLQAVVRAILLDPEARGGPKGDPKFGSLREPVLMLTGMIRAIGGVTDGARLADAAATLGQRPYFSPTVFNYFPPDQTIPGTAILAPEFGIHTTNTAVGRTNLVYTLVYSGYAPDSTIVSSTGTRLNLQQFESLADNPTAMVTRIADVLTGGQMPAAAQALVVTAVNAIAIGPATEQPWKTNRARMGVYLIGSSYHYQVQR
ncbi:MAG: DUF1800 family protein [Betaproteobacteria bacterium]|nr:DUF1800 family protein [Betaproteobacteria bacterium]